MKQSTLELSRTDIEQILHHAHWIPALNGDQQRFLQAKYPGVSFDLIMKQLIDGKYLVKVRPIGELSHFSGWRVHRRLKQVVINL
jgi:hypothetical protein